MYDTTQIQEAIAAHMPRLVEGIQAAERNQSMSAIITIDISAAVEGFLDALIEEATFYQSRVDCDYADEEAESDARHEFCKTMTRWRIREYGMTAREIARIKADTIREIKAAQVQS